MASLLRGVSTDRRRGDDDLLEAGLPVRLQRAAGLLGGPPQQWSRFHQLRWHCGDGAVVEERHECALHATSNRCNGQLGLVTLGLPCGPGQACPPRCLWHGDGCPQAEVRPHRCAQAGFVDKS
jgi:hypothetical protein